MGKQLTHSNTQWLMLLCEVLIEVNSIHCFFVFCSQPFLLNNAGSFCYFPNDSPFWENDSVASCEGWMKLQRSQNDLINARWKKKKKSLFKSKAVTLLVTLGQQRLWGSKGYICVNVSPRASHMVLDSLDPYAQKSHKVGIEITWTKGYKDRNINMSFSTKKLHHRFLSTFKMLKCNLPSSITASTTQLRQLHVLDEIEIPSLA